MFYFFSIPEPSKTDIIVKKTMKYSFLCLAVVGVYYVIPFPKTWSSSLKSACSNFVSKVQIHEYVYSMKIFYFIFLTKFLCLRLQVWGVNIYWRFKKVFWWNENNIIVFFTKFPSLNLFTLLIFRYLYRWIFDNSMLLSSLQPFSYDHKYGCSTRVYDNLHSGWALWYQVKSTWKYRRSISHE